MKAFRKCPVWVKREKVGGMTVVERCGHLATVKNKERPGVYVCEEHWNHRVSQ